MAQAASQYYSVLRLVKRLGCLLFYYSGIEFIIRKIIGTRKVSIIIFHSVNNNKHIPIETNFSISPQNFEKKIKFLKKYNVLSIDELIQFYDGNRRFPKNSIIITFDDGYKDNYLNAYPVLKSHKAPAIIYLTTGYIGGSDWLHLNTIYYLVSRTKESEISIDIPGNSGKILIYLNTDKEKSKAKLFLASLYKNIEYKYRESFIEKICDAFLKRNGNITFPEDLAMLNWDEIKEMHESGIIQFGSHTKSHMILSKGNESEIAEELLDSKKIIEDHLQTSIVHFSYPNGHKEDFTNICKQILRNIGYRTACTTLEGTNRIDSTSDLYELKRLSWKLPNYLLAVKILFNN